MASLFSGGHGSMPRLLLCSPPSAPLRASALTLKGPPARSHAGASGSCRCCSTPRTIAGLCICGWTCPSGRGSPSSTSLCLLWRAAAGGVLRLMHACPACTHGHMLLNDMIVPGARMPCNLHACHATCVHAGLHACCMPCSLHACLYAASMHACTQPCLVASTSKRANSLAAAHLPSRHP